MQTIDAILWAVLASRSALNISDDTVKDSLQGCENPEWMNILGLNDD